LLHQARVHCQGLRDVLGLVDADHLVRQLKHVVAQGNDDELTGAGQAFWLLAGARVVGLRLHFLLANSFLYVFANDSNILVVERSINLVHAVQGTRLENMKCENQ
jgi:hypothetical protein